MKKVLLFLTTTLCCTSLWAQELAYTQSFEEYLSDEIGYFAKMYSMDITRAQDNGCIIAGYLIRECLIMATFYFKTITIIK